MSRIVKCAHIQASNARDDGSPAEIKEAMIQKHIPLIEEAGDKGAQILCLQEIFYGPYFCAKQDIKWYTTAEPVPGPTVERLAEYAKIGIYICYDRHFPECARVLALKGAEILFNPSATTSGKSQYLWQLEQPAQAVANGVFIGANNRIGLEKPWEFGEFYGSSYFVDPRGQILVQGSEDKDEVVMADLDLEQIREVRDGWQFFRDLRPDQYTELTETKGKYR
jgi:predicted amidohydrolase